MCLPEKRFVDLSHEFIIKKYILLSLKNNEAWKTQQVMATPVEAAVNTH